MTEGRLFHVGGWLFSVLRQSQLFLDYQVFRLFFFAVRYQMQLYPSSRAGKLAESVKNVSNITY